MIPLIENIFLDSSALYAYYKGKDVSAKDVLHHLTVMKHRENFLVHDHQINGASEFVSRSYESLSKLLWKLPVDVAKDFLLQNGRLLFVKQEVVDEWFELVSKASSTYFIAGWFLEKYEENSIRKGDFKKFVRENLMNQMQYSTILSPYLPELENFIDKNTGLYDLHIHLNGTTENETVWLEALKNPDKVMDEYSSSLDSKATAIKQLLQIMPEFDFSMFKDCLNKSYKYRKKLVEFVATKIYETSIRIDEIEYLWGDDPDNCHYSEIVKEIIFSIVVMSTLHSTKDERAAKMFHFYLLTKGLFNALLVQQKSQFGFDQFQYITDNGLREYSEKNYKNRFFQMTGYPSNLYAKLVEGRFSPKDTAYKNEMFVNKIVSDFDEFKSKTGMNIELSLVAHFIKKKDNQDYSLGIRHRKLRLSLMKKSVALLKYKQSECGNSKYLVGIDAAANELDASPEVFAPAYSLLRKSGLFHFTYHVGEDFRHLISGIRSIDEAVDYLEMQQGDRLGHCTAIGIDPELWMSRSIGKFYISRGEWLFNLVWMWNIISQDIECSKFHSLLPSVEADIMRYSCEIYKRTYSPYDLFMSWKLRKYDPFVYLKSYRMPYFKSDAVENYSEWKHICKKLEEHTEL